LATFGFHFEEGGQDEGMGLGSGGGAGDWHDGFRGAVGGFDGIGNKIK